MSYRSSYTRGQWATICDVCGRKFKASALRQRWDGLKTCEQDWETRQPQDFVRGVADYQAPSWTRPEQSNTFVPIFFTSILNAVTTSTATLVTKKIVPVLKAITASVSNTVTLVANRFYFRAITATVANTVTLVKTTILGVSSKVLDANAVNKTTLG